MHLIIIVSPMNKERASNIELLRIVSILFVMILHANYLALEPPSPTDITASFGNAFIRSFIEALSCVCVNIFVIISGWFGIRFKVVRLLELIFQVIFISFLLYAFMRSIGLTGTMESADFFQLLFIKNGAYWFVRAYLILYVFAPVLNSFVDNIDRNQIRLFLIGFFVFQSIFGFFRSDVWFSEGYSPLSFMGLYVLARYVRMYPNQYVNFNWKVDLIIYLVLSAITAICALLLTPLFTKGATIMFLYSSPLVIMASLSFFLFFTKISIRSRIINWVAISAFAAYLVHCSPHLFHLYYLEVIKRWYVTESIGMFLLYTICLIVAFFVFSIMLDKLRILIWNEIMVLFKHRVYK